MNTISFLNQGLLWGLLLASIPVIIHLLFRRRFRKIDWAPMKYLKLTVQRNRRRIRLEQLLLLLVRTAMILLLFFLVARPIIHAQGLAGWLGGGSRTSQILVIDDSLSMGRLEQGRSAFARAQELAIEVVRAISNKDRLTLVAASQAGTPLVRDVEIANLDEIIQLIRQLKPADSFVAWKPAMQAIDDLITSGTFPLREVSVITDLRRAGWNEELAQQGTRWAGERVRMRVFDVGDHKTDNLALVGLDQADRLALVGAPTRFEAQIRNGTSSVSRGVEAHFEVDGKPSLLRLPEIEPGQTASVPIWATFDEAGAHHVSVRLPDDALAGDNQRWVAVKAQPHVEALLVDGEPSSEPLAGEVDFLALALSLGIGQADAFRVEVVTDSEWAAMPEATPDLLVLANVPTIAAEQAEQLERLVRAGMGLMIFPGEQVDPDNYNQSLFKGGDGLLPASLESTNDDELSGLVLEDLPDGPLDALTQLNAGVLERIGVRKFYELRLPPELPRDVRVVARWNNPTGVPAAIEKVVGKGHVLLWTVSADKLWSDWPTEPSYVMAMRESAKAVARSGGGLESVTAGQRLRRVLPKGHETRSATIAVPGAPRPRPLTVETTGDESKGNPAKVLVWADTRRAGVYQMTWQDTLSGPGAELFAVSPDQRESDLERITPEELKKLWLPLEVEVVSAGAGSDGVIALQGQELWRSLAVCLLCVSIFEAGFATFAGRQR